MLAIVALLSFACQSSCLGQDQVLKTLQVLPLTEVCCSYYVHVLTQFFLACDVHPYCRRLGEEGNEVIDKSLLNIKHCFYSFYQVCKYYDENLLWVVDKFHIKGHVVSWNSTFTLVIFSIQGKSLHPIRSCLPLSSRSTKEPTLLWWN